MTKAVPRPFVKWAGGKEQLLDHISRNLPITFNHYFEPFVGGGAVFFHLCRSNLLRGKASLSDINNELMTAYITIRDSVEDLIEDLRSGIYEPSRFVFEGIRAWDRNPSWGEVDDVQRTARLIYLNKTCYNGLYRVNQKGHFNVPFGRHSNPMICDSENLRAVSQALQGVLLSCLDFRKAVREAEKEDFIYIDPPYHPLNATSNFTKFTAEGFGAEEQIGLASLYKELDNRGCLLLESNSSTDFVHKLYLDSGFTLDTVEAKRAISCDPEGRGVVPELLIRNYRDTGKKRIN